MKQFYDVTEVAERLKVNPRTVYNYIRGFTGPNRPKQRKFYLKFALQADDDAHGKLCVAQSALSRFLNECNRDSAYGTCDYHRFARHQDTRCYTVYEAARLLGVCNKTAYNYIKHGRLNAICLPGGALRVTPSQIKDFKASRCEPATPSVQ